MLSTAAVLFKNLAKCKQLASDFATAAAVDAARASAVFSGASTD
jgi:hypothetical protein